MINCFINNNLNNKAIELYELYDKHRNDISHNLYIKACKNTKQYNKCTKLIDNVYFRIIKQDNLKNNWNIDMINNIIDFYGNIGNINRAATIFNQISNNKKDTVSINCMMKAYINNHKNDKAIEIYEQYHNLHDNISNGLYISANTKKIGCMNSDDIIAKIKDENIDIVCVGAIMNYFINNNNHKLAIELYEKYINIFKHKALCIISAHFEDSTHPVIYQKN
eukprot:244192_1